MSRPAQSVETVNSGRRPVADVTAKKQLKDYEFKPGQSGNPAGRPLGARSKFSQAFHEDLLKIWSEEGERAMRKVAKHDPATFVRVAASLMPKQVKAEINNLRTLVVNLIGADEVHLNEYDEELNTINEEGEVIDDPIGE